MSSGHMWLVGAILDHTDHMTILSLQDVLLGTVVTDYPQTLPVLKF